MAYIQQVLVKAAVVPWDHSLVPADVFRSPLGQVFSLLDEIRNHVHTDRLATRLAQLVPSFTSGQAGFSSPELSLG